MNVLDPSWILVQRQSTLHKFLQRTRQLIVSRTRLTQHDEGLRLDQAVTRIVAHHRALQNSLMLQQTIFNLSRRNINARYFQHVVTATVVPEVAIRVDVNLISTREPITGKRRFRLLMRVPVTERG